MSFIPERTEGEVFTKWRYINPLPFTFCFNSNGGKELLELYQ